MSSLAFLREFARHPNRLGSVIPSSRALAQTVVDTANILDDNVILELGAGTGPISTELARRYPDHRMVALEPTHQLAEILRERLPRLQVEECYADENLSQWVESWGIDQVHRVVSGLPWTMWDERLQTRVLDGIVSVMAQDGRFLTYTYVSSQIRPAGARYREILGRYFKKVWTTPIVWANVPPAVVMVGDQPRRR